MVWLRRKGRLSRLEGPAIDFNRHGLAIVLDQPLPKDTNVFISLLCGDIRIDNVLGVVHNCISHEHGFRCGIQFRNNSQLQFDKPKVEKGLRILEARFRSQEQADNAE